MRLVFAEPAARDLEDIIDYIALDSSKAAEGVYRAIVAAAGRLKDFPESGHPGRASGTRELSVTALPLHHCLRGQRGDRDGSRRLSWCSRFGEGAEGAAG